MIICSARFYPDGHGFWALYCPEWGVELSLVEAHDLIEAAMIADWLPCSCGLIGCSHKTQEQQLAEAIDVLKASHGREFPLSWGSVFIDRIFDNLPIARE